MWVESIQHLLQCLKYLVIRRRKNPRTKKSHCSQGNEVAGIVETQVRLGSEAERDTCERPSWHPGD
jgi:hypothetical protein